MIKRVVDILLSGVGIVVLAIPCCVVAAMIKCDSKGPVFYRQTRVGRNNKDFKIYKLRTMMSEDAADSCPLAIGEDDPRITRVGQFLRKHKIDEFPQLLNVFKGDMSLVGPRPIMRCFVDSYTDEQMRVLDVRPGITDPASIKYYNESELLSTVENPIDYYLKVIQPDKLRLNKEYIENSNLWIDFKILVKTLFSV